MCFKIYSSFRASLYVRLAACDFIVSSDALLGSIHSNEINRVDPNNEKATRGSCQDDVSFCLEGVWAMIQVVTEGVYLKWPIY